MADLRLENPQTTVAFVAALAAEGVKLPLRVCDQDLGVILDAADRDVLTVDVNNECPDDEVVRIANWIVLAVNTCGGFMAVRSDNSNG